MIEMKVSEVSGKYLSNSDPKADSVSVKDCYKQTEIGVLPLEWEVCELEDAVVFLDGMRHPIKSGDRARIGGDYPYYGASGIVDYVNDYIFDEDLILLGEDGENILSRSLPLAFRVSGKVWVNNHAHVLRPRSDFEIGYLTEFLESLDYSLLNSGTAQPKLNKRSCSKIKVAKPPKEEQTAIANTLSDVDALIHELEKLIAKKQAIKTATMQQLLTGKTRLPPYAHREDGTPKGYKQSELGEIPEDWETPKFGDICTLINGRGFKPYEWKTEGLPIIRIQNLNGSDDFNCYQGYYDPKIFVQKGQLLFAWSGSRGTSFGPHLWHGNDALLNYHTWKLVLQREDVCPNYFFHILKQLTKKIEDSAHGASALVHTQKGEMESFLVLLPIDQKEQIGIATTLSFPTLWMTFNREIA